MQKEEQRDCQKSRNKNLQPRAGERVLGPGEGVGGGVNPSPREEGKGMNRVQRAKPPQPRGLVGFYEYVCLIVLMSKVILESRKNQEGNVFFRSLTRLGLIGIPWWFLTKILKTRVGSAPSPGSSQLISTLTWATLGADLRNF